MKRLIPLALAFLSFTAPAVAQDKPRAVIELFTSQGCSSCPPADKLMNELARDPTLIVITLPVDYWDYLGWKDTLAHSSFTHRQKAYSAQRGDRQVYTPQAVINGAVHAVGSERNAIDKAIGNTRQKALTVNVSIEKTDSGYRAVLPASQGANGHVWLIPMVRERSVQIGRGENTGRSITYSNVARGLTRLAVWNGDGQTIDIAASSIPAESEGIVVLVQSGSDKKPGMIIGAARHTLP
jgi:hypothetical protein